MRHQKGTPPSSFFPHLFIVVQTFRNVKNKTYTAYQCIQINTLHIFLVQLCTISFAEYMPDNLLFSSKIENHKSIHNLILRLTTLMMDDEKQIIDPMTCI